MSVLAKWKAAILGLNLLWDKDRGMYQLKTETETIHWVI